jgi:predicted TIM-barrel fold metal-dependent hydrolase
LATLKLKFGVISTDEHIQEARDVWTSRMSKEKFGDDIPHVAEQPDGSEAWVIQGQVNGNRYQLGAVPAATIPRNKKLHRWEEMPQCAYVPSERLKAMDQDEVDTHTFFPNISGLSNNKFQKEGSEEYRLACIRAYNDWLAEEWVAYSPRYIAQCISPMWDVNLAAAEIERSVKMGHKGVVWHGAPEVLGFPHFNEPYWDPVYQLCNDLGVPLCLHLGAVPTLTTWEGYAPNTALAMHSTRAISSNMQVVANVLFSGIMDRFPKLKFITVESGIGWIPYLLETADHEYEQLKVREDGLPTKPSDAFKRQMWANFWFEDFGMRNRYDIGVDNIIYETDFPHPTSTFPNSKWCREHSLRDVPKDEQKLMLMENAIELYLLDVDRSLLPAPRIIGLKGETEWDLGGTRTTGTGRGRGGACWAAPPPALRRSPWPAALRRARRRPPRRLRPRHRRDRPPARPRRPRRRQRWQPSMAAPSATRTQASLQTWTSTSRRRLRSPTPAPAPCSAGSFARRSAPTCRPR